MHPKRPVYIVDGCRTPFLKVLGRRGAFSASDLAVSAAQGLLLKLSLKPDAIDSLILGSVMPSEDEANIGRIVSQRLGCPVTTPAWTVARNCASGMQAIDSAAKDIAMGRHDLVLAGGAEAMSRAPLIFRPSLVDWLSAFRSGKSITKKLSLLARLRPSDFSPIIALLRGLRDPLCGLNMGQTAEILANQFSITRHAMDAFSMESHQRAAEATLGGLYGQIVPLIDRGGKVYTQDTGIRSDSTIEKLSRLKPYFERPDGLVTAGNSSQITDGAAMLLLASQEAVEQYQLPVLGTIVDTQWAGVDPTVMGLGPVMATTPILKRQGLSLADIDTWEINEAFAVQVIACLRAWESDAFCRQTLGLEEAMGTIDTARLNILGGAIALGHPVGASGARIVMQCLSNLSRKQQGEGRHLGVATICVGGGQGGAMLLSLGRADIGV